MIEVSPPRFSPHPEPFAVFKTTATRLLASPSSAGVVALLAHGFVTNRGLWWDKARVERRRLTGGSAAPAVDVLLALGFVDKLFTSPFCRIGACFAMNEKGLAAFEALPCEERQKARAVARAFIWREIRRKRAMRRIALEMQKRARKEVRA